MARKRVRRTAKQRALPPWAAAFFAALEATGNVSAACRAAGVGRTTVFERKQANAEFASRYEEALENGLDDLEFEARRRALEGTERIIFHQGKEVGRTKEYSDQLLMFLLKAHRPWKYRETWPRSPGQPVAGPWPALCAQDLSDDQLAALAAGGVPAVRVSPPDNGRTSRPSEVLATPSSAG